MLQGVLVYVATAASQATATDYADPQGFRQPSARDLRLCPDLKSIDYRRLGREAEGMLARVDADTARLHRRLRGGDASPAPESAVVVLSTAIPASSHSAERRSTSSYVWRDANGNWQVDRVDEVPVELGGLHSVRGRLSAPDAQLLDRALRNDCLLLEPDFLGTDVPQRRGARPRIDPCYGFTTGPVRIAHESRVRIMHHCRPRAAFEIIARIVASPRIEGGGR